jgi:hypothetical protein
MRVAVRVSAVVAVTVASLGVVNLASAGGQGADAPDAFDYWTPERLDSAVPRDLVVDNRGLGYLRGANGGLSPYGHSIATAVEPLTSSVVTEGERAPRITGTPTPAAVTFGALSPDGDIIGGSHSFEARVTSPEGIRGVTAFVGRVDSGYQSFRMSYVGNDGGAQVWRANLQGFSDGDWNWYVQVRDGGPRGGARTDSDIALFEVDTGGGGGGVVSERWTGGGTVQTAAGRIVFTMPGGNYVCSGTAITDGTTGRSIILTAAHCIYDDVAKVFSSNAMFIPNQDDGGTDRTDSNCGNDPLGCWAVDHGVVDVNWANRVFPDNIAWDYGYYVVSDSGAHSGTAADPALDVAAGSLDVDFTTPAVGQTATALGYSYADDPNFMYCQEPMGTNGSANYWLDTCDLTGGSSGGPWMQPLDGGNGMVMSVNSWGYTTRAGMAGPKLHGNSAQLLFDVSTFSDLSSSARGVVVDPANPPTSTTTTAPPTTTTTTTPTTTSPPTTTTTTAPTTTAPPTTTQPAAVVLTVDSYKLKGIKHGQLDWTGTTGEVEILRDGQVLDTVLPAGSSSFLDVTDQKGGGSTTWQVCEAEAGCSNIVRRDW